MKHILLLTVILIASCGKNDIPEYKEFEKEKTSEELKPRAEINENAQVDKSEGVEKEEKKETNDDKINKEVSGLIEITSIKYKNFFDKIPFSNSFDIKNFSQDLIVRNHHDKKLENLQMTSEKIFIKQWSRDKNILKDDEFKITFTSSSEMKQNILYLKQAGKLKAIRQLDQNFSFIVSGLELESILVGKTELFLSNFESDHFNESLTKPFVITFDGVTGQVHYFRNIDEMQFFIKENGLSNSLLINEYNLFQDDFRTDEITWFTMLTPEHFKVFYKGTFKELKQSYHSQLQKNSQTLIRSNGISTNKISLSKPSNGTVYFKIKGEVQTLSFKEYTHNQDYRRHVRMMSGRGVNITAKCTEYHRSTSSQTIRPIHMKDLQNYLRIETDTYLLDPNRAFYFKEIQDKNSKYFILGFNDNFSKLKLSIKNLPLSNLIPVGFYDQKCSKNIKSFKAKKLKFNKIQPEHHLKLEVTSFVEKFEE